MLAVESRKSQLTKYFTRIERAELGEEIKADLAKHGAVLVCGYVERCVEIVIVDRLSTRAQPRVLSFIKSHFKKGTNYDCEPICQLLERFDQDWTRKFRKFLEENGGLSEQMTSAYALRNSIAHGGDANRGLAGVKELYGAAIRVIDGLIAATS
jgi:hypothetical protein